MRKSSNPPSLSFFLEIQRLAKPFVRVQKAIEVDSGDIPTPYMPIPYITNSDIPTPAVVCGSKNDETYNPLTKKSIVLEKSLKQNHSSLCSSSKEKESEKVVSYSHPENVVASIPNVLDRSVVIMGRYRNLVSIPTHPGIPISQGESGIHRICHTSRYSMSARFCCIVSTYLSSSSPPIRSSSEPLILELMHVPGYFLDTLSSSSSSSSSISSTSVLERTQVVIDVDGPTPTLQLLCKRELKRNDGIYLQLHIPASIRIMPWIQGAADFQINREE